MVKLHTLAGPYTMVIPASWPDPYYGDNPPPGWTIYYGDNFTHRPGHISWQHPVVRPDPRWPIRYGRLSTPAGRKIWPNQVHGLCNHGPRTSCGNDGAPQGSENDLGKTIACPSRMAHVHHSDETSGPPERTLEYPEDLLLI